MPEKHRVLQTGFSTLFCKRNFFVATSGKNDTKFGRENTRKTPNLTNGIFATFYKYFTFFVEQVVKTTQIFNKIP
jgi:hypothetical protein